MPNVPAGPTTGLRKLGVNAKSSPSIGCGSNALTSCDITAFLLALLPDRSSDSGGESDPEVRRGVGGPKDAEAEEVLPLEPLRTGLSRLERKPTGLGAPRRGM